MGDWNRLVDRKRLDFSFDKICSVTLSKVNVYCCLTCGRFLTGRTANTPAHSHSLETEHCLFMHLATGRAYCLPDGVECDDPSFADIRVIFIAIAF